MKTISFRTVDPSFFCFLFICTCFFSCRKNNLTEIPSSKESNSEALSSVMTATADKANIILIVGDDVGFEIPTADGGQSYSTPTLDIMAKRGVQFMQCHASPMCSPSRTALLTGKYNFRNYFTWGSLPGTEKTLGNMLADAGYSTCVSGKWQFDGGETAIHNFGFQKYCVWDAFKYDEEEGENMVGSAYKNPKVYVNGAYLPSSQVQNKYGEDIFCQYVKDFIDSNTKKPFFIFYPMVLCHDPFSPTPDDPQFASWNPHKDKSDTSFFPSMVKYMDKKIREVIDEVNAKGLANKTIILFIGDNGTPLPIYSKFKGKTIKGAKSQTNEWGTHVPLLVYGSSKIKNRIINDLISFPDFLPTLADIAAIPTPTNYGTLDGVSFYNQIIGKAGTPRTWIYNYYNPHPDTQPENTVIWSQDISYKLYNGAKTGFYNTTTDMYEKSPIPDSRLTPAQQQSKNNLQADINSVH